MTIEGPRVMDKPLPWCDIDTGPVAPGYPITITAGQGWVVLDDGAAHTPTIVNRSYYDLSGYTLKELTAFIQGVDIQEAFMPFGSISCTVVDMITTEFVNDATLLAAHVYTTGNGDLPGFPNSTYDMSQVIYGRTRTFVDNSSWDDIALQGTTIFGTGAATSGEKLYITRVVYIITGAAGVITPAKAIHIPPCDYVTAVIVAKEKDIPYLMRLKRGYEHTSGL